MNWPGAQPIRAAGRSNMRTPFLSSRSPRAEAPSGHRIQMSERGAGLAYFPPWSIGPAAAWEPSNRLYEGLGTVLGSGTSPLRTIVEVFGAERPEGCIPPVFRRPAHQGAPGCTSPSSPLDKPCLQRDAHGVCGTAARCGSRLPVCPVALGARKGVGELFGGSSHWRLSRLTGWTFSRLLSLSTSR